MDDFGMLARDFGIRPLGKSAPMKVGVASDGGERRPRPSVATSSPFVEDRNSDNLLFSDVFGGPPKYASTNSKPSSTSDFDYESIFKSSNTTIESKSRSSSSSVPVYDKPVYDDDIFDGLPGLKSKSVSSSARYEENVFASMASPAKQSDHFDDLLGNLGRTQRVEPKNNKSSRGFDDLLPGFGSGSPAGKNRPTLQSSQPSKPTGNSNQTASDVMEDPFVVLESTSTPGVSSPGLFTNPLEEISKISKSGNTNVDRSSVSGGIFDDIDPLNAFGKSVPAFSSEMNNRGKDGSSSRAGSSVSSTPNSTSKESFGKSPFKYSESHSQNKVPVDDLQDSHQTLFDMPAVKTNSQKYFGQTSSSPSYVNASETNSQVDMSPRSEHVQPTDDVWLTVSEIPLFTQATSAPAPSRPPPPIPRNGSKSERGFFASISRKKGNEFVSSPNSAKYSQSPKPFSPAAKSPMVSPLDELEDFAMGRARNNIDDNSDVHSGEEMNTHSAAAASAMKEAMDRAEAKFRHAKEVKEREYAKSSRSKEDVQLGKDEEAMQETQERSDHEWRQREEKERERRRFEKERERAREIEREKAKQAVERANREARERAAVEARERAAAEARLKAERAAVQRAQAEARGRAAADARGRAERAAAEARERANAEAREKDAQEKAAVARSEADSRRRAERAAVERVAAEARERAAAEARERASASAAAARMNQQKNDNDLESFFSMGSRPSSAPRPRESASDPVPDPQFQSRGGTEGARRTSSSSSGVSSNVRRASSTTNIVDDLTSIFGAAPSAGEFQDVEGETEERRRARLERHQRTQERAAKALAEKNQRDLQTQRDQEERHRIADTLDVEIKRWTAGKEGNLRALLSTLQYVLWPECGWQPVSLTDLITGASVKKVYRKATLCIHPDKVQQKGANLQQKYIAEKVFDLLKEAWNKFNSEELF